MSYAEAKARYAAIGVDTEAAIARLSWNKSDTWNSET